MKTIIIFIGFSFLQNICLAQGKILQKQRYLQVDIGLSKHGTGDMSGYSINIDYKRSVNRFIFLSFGLGSTIHDGSLQIMYTDNGGNQVDASYRYNTGGIQLNSKIGLSAFNTKKSDVGLQIGGISRYQTSSYFDEIIILYPAATGLQMPVTAVVNKSPQKRISLGGIGQFYYDYKIDSKLFFGLNSSLQIDTNGDVITQFMIHAGISL